MRALSERQATRCETAKNKTCRCRCQGALHGAKRRGEAEILFFQSLPSEDPHHVRSQEEKRLRRKAQREVAKARNQGQLWTLSSQPDEGD